MEGEGEGGGGRGQGREGRTLLCDTSYTQCPWGLGGGGGTEIIMNCQISLFKQILRGGGGGGGGGGRKGILQDLSPVETQYSTLTYNLLVRDIVPLHASNQPQPEPRLPRTVPHSLTIARDS